MEMGRPVGPVEVILRFLEEELGLLRRFFLQYAFLYQYFPLGAELLNSDLIINCSLLIKVIHVI